MNPEKRIMPLKDSKEQQRVLFSPGTKVTHPELGEGVVTGSERKEFFTVFFRAHGERLVPAEFLSVVKDHYDRVIDSMTGATKDGVEALWLALEAEQLPLMDSAATLTAAKVDLLPHQVVLVHRIVQARPKRFLVADEVGLGKTIETALILRELASRGELTRAIMVVPAGLVENWRSELNDLFNLDFEVFGSEGDVTDRKTNAFAKHDRLIVSIDTLKRPERIKRLLDAPPWDLAVFDEAHHLSVYRNGNRVKKTENFKLAEALRDHCRDLVLLSATPHQGDHFRFWMLIRLLTPELFESAEDMIENRHRLNAVVIRRTKADACAQDGSPLFSRRMVHTQAFHLAEHEKRFYGELLAYLRDGYDLAAKQGNKGRTLGFVMTIFQKIAASSFAAIKSTLERRYLMLTIQESIERDELLDVDGRNRLLDDARKIIHLIYEVPSDIVGNARVEQILSDAKLQLLKKHNEALRFVKKAESYSDSEFIAASGETSASLLVSLALPEERARIQTLLAHFPQGPETKSSMLVHALSQIWENNPNEKVVIFATYLGTVDAIKNHLGKVFPEVGVSVLKGGDHGAKTAAQKRFKRPDGPNVLVCTAAGREGINLQFAKVLFNYDLPWNPMDLEQRIGRIHRYGQEFTAQVYNLVAADTIEGQIFLLLEEKLGDIAQALGKVDEKGRIAEDLRGQVLGQLSNCLKYNSLYKEALDDPSLVRTREELDVAMANANLARDIVFELFQDLDGFNLGDYQKFDDEGRGMDRLIRFVSRAVENEGGEFVQKGGAKWLLKEDSKESIFTTDRDFAMKEEQLNLVGLEHPKIQDLLSRHTSLGSSKRAICGTIDGVSFPGLLYFWFVQTQGSDSQFINYIIPIGITKDGERAPWLEKTDERVLNLKESDPVHVDGWKTIAMVNKQKIGEILHRELQYKGMIEEGTTYSSNLLAVFGIDA